MTKDAPICLEVEAFNLLDQLQGILDRDPLIDELGFIHPSQLMMLNKGEDTSILTSGENKGDATLGSELSEANEVEGNNDLFWSRDHKLGISTKYLFPLYRAAKHRFMDAYGTYNKLVMKIDNLNSGCSLSELEDQVMKHSKALMLLSSDFGTAWNARKLVISKRGDISISDELLLSALVLSFAPKSENAWNYRRWIIKRIAGNCSTLEVILEKESELVEKIAEKSKMNYRAWNHRCWLISYMNSGQVLRELNTNRNWAVLHVADNSCFHYRRKLILRMLDDMSHGKVADTCISHFESLKQLWKDELDWNEVLIRRYIGREALWLHRRFLSVYWIKHFGTAQHGSSLHLSERSDGDNFVPVFIIYEVGLLQDCLHLPDSIFEDVKSQAIHSASYFLWLNREILYPAEFLKQKLLPGDLRTLLNNLCPEKTTVWDCLLCQY